MKISQSAIQLDYHQKKETSLAQLTNQNVRILDNNSGEAGSTATRRADIKQTQQQTLSDSISSHSQSLITDSKSGETSYFESAEFLEAVSSVFLKENMMVITVQTLNGTRVRATQMIEATSVTQFESDTHIQANAMGIVTTEDGREIDFLLELNYDRNIKTTQESTFTGERNLIDPLVINLNGGAPSLSSGYFEFDLDSDGTKETLNQTSHGTGFLALDKNGNGEIDNGQELFGPNSNSGFGEIAQYDDDDNGWIDENDAVFSQLSFMDFDENGEQRTRSLSEVGLGALYLGSEEMDLDLFDSDGNFQANIAKNGVALKENGQAVSLQEIHYADQAVGGGEATMEKADNINLTANSGVFGSQAINLDGSNSIGITLTSVRIESALTQFQFDNQTLNGRNADTQVTITRAEQDNFIVQNGIRNRSDFSLGPTIGSNRFTIGANANASMALQQNTQSSEQLNSQFSSNNNGSQSNVSFSRREEIQSIFQARFESGFTITNTNAGGNDTQSSQPEFKVPTLSQSIFLQDERQQYENQYKGGSKLDQLKQLVSDLKDMREQQKESQDKISIYDQVGRF